MINKFITFSVTTILILSAAPSLAQPDPYNGYTVQHFTDENGLPQNSINDLLIDDNGFLWLACQVGIVRFNGSSFKTYYPGDKRFMESNVLFLGKNDNGNIYFQTDDQNLYCYPGKNGHMPEAVNTSTMRGPWLMNADKQLFDFTHFLNDKQSGPYSSIKDLIFKDLSKNNANFFVIDPAHIYLVYGDTLYYYDDTGLQKLFGSAGNDILNYLSIGERFYVLKKDSVLGVYEHGVKVRGAGLIGGDLSRFGLNEKLQAATYQLFPGETPHLLVDNKLYSISAGTEGRLNTLFLLDLDFTTHISAITYNKELDLLLIATRTEGFYMLHKSRFQSPAVSDTLKQALSQYLVGPLALLHGKDILTKRFIFNIAGKYKPLPEAHPGYQKCLYIDQKENVWGSVFNLPRKLNASMETVKVFPTVMGQIVNYAEDDEGNLYCLTTRSIYRLQTDSFQLIYDQKQLDGIKGDNETICQVEGHRFWVANTDGLFEYDPVSNKATVIKALAGAHVRSINKCRDGSILLGTYGQGYYYYYRDHFFKMPLDKNGFLITAHCFLEDKNGAIWICCNKGLFKVPKADMDAWCDSSSSQIYYYYYGMQDGLKTNEFNGGYNAAGLITQDGFIALLSMKGLVYFNVDSLPSDFPRGRIDITNIEIDGKYVVKTNTIELDPDYNSLLLEVSCPFLGNRNNLYLEYNLRGLNDQWKAVPEDGVVNLSRLGPGNYMLRIRKVNGFGKNNYLYNECSVVVTQHLYRTAWFSLLIIMVILLLLTLFVRASLKLREKRQEVRVKAEKLKGTVVALEETVEKLQESQKALLQTSKVREKLISLVIHDLRSPLRFLTMLAGDLHDNQGNFSNDDIRERTYWIKKGTNDVYNFSEDFLLWVTSQKNNFSITKRLFPIKPLLQEIYDFFKEQIHQKGNSLFYEAAEDLNIYSDPHILITIIRNLADNANKYTDQGKIVISAYEEHGQIVIAVSDTGKGMSPRQMEAFLQNDNMDEVKSGSQLGHKFVFDLTKRINGTVSIDSKEGIGTTVRLKFPAGPVQ